MNNNQDPFHDNRQFNLPGFLGGQFLGYLGGQIFGPPGSQPGPGGSFPGGPGGQGPGFPTGGQTGGAPNTPPPPFTPEQPQFQTFAVDPGAIRGCMYRFTYVWLRRDAFWFFPIFIGRQSIAGYRWTGFRWAYFGIDLDNIQSFQCF